jgi:hypothetical protein
VIAKEENACLNRDKHEEGGEKLKLWQQLTFKQKKNTKKLKNRRGDPDQLRLQGKGGRHDSPIREENSL